jgi:hypothetical protein
MAVSLAKAKIGSVAKPRRFVMRCAQPLREFGRLFGSPGTVPQSNRSCRAFHDCRIGTSGNGDQDTARPQKEKTTGLYHRVNICPSLSSARM